MTKVWVLFLMLNLAAGSLLFSQNTTAKAAKKAAKIALGKFMISPVVASGYSPGLVTLFSVGGLTRFKTNKSDSLIQRSLLSFTLAYCTTGLAVGNCKLTSYWLQDKLRIDGDFWFKNMPDNYWGIGYESDASTPQSDSTTAYQRLWWSINTRFFTRVK